MQVARPKAAECHPAPQLAPRDAAARRLPAAQNRYSADAPPLASRGDRVGELRPAAGRALRHRPDRQGIRRSPRRWTPHRGARPEFDRRVEPRSQRPVLGDGRPRQRGLEGARCSSPVRAPSSLPSPALRVSPTPRLSPREKRAMAIRGCRARAGPGGGGRYRGAGRFADPCGTAPQTMRPRQR